jgi:hypothetical protein
MSVTATPKTEHYTLKLEKELKSRTEEEYGLQMKLHSIQDTSKECDREMLDAEVMCMGIRKKLRRELDDSITMIVHYKCLLHTLEGERKNASELMDDIAENKENDMGNDFQNCLVVCNYIDYLKREKHTVVMDSRLDEYISRVQDERKRVLLEMHTLVRTSAHN